MLWLEVAVVSIHFSSNCYASPLGRRLFKKGTPHSFIYNSMTVPFDFAARKEQTLLRLVHTGAGLGKTAMDPFVCFRTCLVSVSCPDRERRRHVLAPKT